MTFTTPSYVELRAENNELRAYLKCFLRATVMPEDNGRDMGVHEANPTMDWQFAMVDDAQGGRRITGGQIRRAAELIGHDLLQVEAPARTISQELAETAELRRQRAALRAVITGMIESVKGRKLEPVTAETMRFHAGLSTNTYKVELNKRAKFLDEAVEMGKNILDQTKKV